MRTTGSLALALLLLLLVGCGEAPNPSILERARNAIAAAEAERAEVYAPEELAAARQALEEAEAEYRSQKRALRKKKQPGEELAERATELARTAASEADARGKAAARGARDDLSRGETALISAEAVLARLARCGRQKTIDGLRELGERFASLKELHRSATESFDSGSYAEVSSTSERLAREAERFSTDAGHVAYDSGCR